MRKIFSAKYLFLLVIVNNFPVVQFYVYESVFMVFVAFPKYMVWKVPPQLFLILSYIFIYLFSNTSNIILQFISQK